MSAPRYILHNRAAIGAYGIHSTHSTAHIRSVFPMRTEIEFAPSFATLNVELGPGESIKAEAGAMLAQQGVEMQTGMGGRGLFGGISRMISGESFMLNTFTAKRGSGWVSLAPSTPGDIFSFDLRPGENLFIQSGSFLACSENVQTDSKFQGFRGFFSGESLFFIRAYAERGQGGTVILHITFALKQDQACSVNVVFSIAGGCCVAGKNDKEIQHTLKFDQ